MFVNCRLYGDIQLFDKKNRLIQMGRKLEASLHEINTTGLKKKMLRESSDYNQQPSVQFYIYRNEKDVSKNQKFVDKKGQKTPTIIYQFHYNNNVRQHTKSDVGLRCLWCMLNCMSLNGLFMHLKLCHLRFLFSFTTNDKGAKIDVHPNQQFDGSYEGSPFDLLLQRSGLLCFISNFFNTSLVQLCFRSRKFQSCTHETCVYHRNSNLFEKGTQK